MSELSCARCRVQVLDDDVDRLIERGWCRINVRDVTSRVDLRWVCADCWRIFVAEDHAKEATLVKSAAVSPDLSDPKRKCQGPVNFADQGIEVCTTCGGCICCDFAHVDHTQAEYECFRDREGYCHLRAHEDRACQTARESILPPTTETS